MKVTNKKYINLNLANEEERAESFIIDFIISSIFGLTISFLTFKNFSLAFLIYIITRFLYYFSFELLLGRTLGKYQTQTKVVNLNGEKPTKIQLIKRNLSRFISVFSGISDEERAIHDTLSNTFVIKNKKLKKIKFNNFLILFINFLSIIWVAIYNFDPVLTVFYICSIPFFLLYIYGFVFEIKKMKIMYNRRE